MLNLLTSIILNFACGYSDWQCIDQFVQFVKNNAGSAVDRIDHTPVPRVVLEYSADKLRDPFSYETADLRSNGQMQWQDCPDQDRTRDYLERYKLSELLMVGYLQCTDKILALVQDPTGKVHLLQQGAYLGTNSGKILAITTSHIAIQQDIPDGIGGWRQDLRYLRLRSSI